MKVKVLKSFDGYRAGQVFDWGDGMARVLISRGLVEEASQDAVERAVEDEVTERAVLQQPVKKRQK